MTDVAIPIPLVMPSPLVIPSEVEESLAILAGMIRDVSTALDMKGV
jgi:hypothetical protein